MPYTDAELKKMRETAAASMRAKGMLAEAFALESQLDKQINAFLDSAQDAGLRPTEGVDMAIKLMVASLCAFAAGYDRVSERTTWAQYIILMMEDTLADGLSKAIVFGATGPDISTLAKEAGLNG